jgi:cytochrome P450
VDTDTVRADLLSDPQTYARAVPHPEFARRRAVEPVGWVAERRLRRRSHGAEPIAQDGTGYWAVTRFDAVDAASRQPQVFSSAARGAFLADPVSQGDLQRMRQVLVNMDDPAHGRIRKLITAAFTPRAVRAMQASIATHAASVVRRAIERGSFDAVHDLAAELPLLVLADLLGVPRADRGLLLRWTNNLVGFDDPEYGGGSVEVYQQTFAEAFRYALDVAADKRAHPGADLMSLLVRAEVDGRRLRDSEFCHLWLLLVTAGNETTRHLISGGLQALLEWPHERRRLVADPALIPCTVEEMLRWVTPIMQFRRTAMMDTVLHGQPIRAGDKVVLYYVSANRDERVFAEPDRFRIDRSPNPHISFGSGPHFCLGARLARTEAAAVLRELVPHLERLEPAGPVVRLASNFMNGIKSMPLRFST